MYGHEAAACSWSRKNEQNYGHLFLVFCQRLRFGFGHEHVSKRKEEVL